jgi:hypothetical protein
MNQARGAQGRTGATHAEHGAEFCTATGHGGMTWLLAAPCPAPTALWRCGCASIADLRRHGVRLRRPTSRRGVP